jgi:hypothetical protein
MKKFILILAIVIVIGLIVWGVWFLALGRSSSRATSSNNNQSGSLPSTPSSIPSTIQSRTQSGTSVRIQNVSSPQNPEVAKDFLGEIQNADQIALGGTVVVSPYALQIWGDTNKGGEALLEDESSTGWMLISLGGGEWTVLALVQVGVPVSLAQQLVAGLVSGTFSPSVGAPIAIPPGNTIAIGTADGTVTMNNFYNSAAYIDQAQQTVVIEQSSTYSISYNIADSSFTLNILGTPSEATRQGAEAAFLAALGISQQDACELSVYENSQQGAKFLHIKQCLPVAVKLL